MLWKVKTPYLATKQSSVKKNQVVVDGRKAGRYSQYDAMFTASVDEKHLSALQRHRSQPVSQIQIH